MFCLSGQRPGLSAQGYLWPTCPCRSNLCRPYLSHMSTCRLAFAFPYLLNLKAGFDLWSDFIRHQNNHDSCPEWCLRAPKNLATRDCADGGVSEVQIPPLQQPVFDFRRFSGRFFDHQPRLSPFCIERGQGAAGRSTSAHVPVDVAMSSNAASGTQAAQCRPNLPRRCARIRF